VRLDPSARRAWVGDQEILLTTQLFDLLSYFLEHRGEAISFETLAAEVWAYPHGAGDHHFLHTAVYRLRRILSSAGLDDLVDGIRGYGYRVSAGQREPAVLVEAARSPARAIGVFDPSDPDLRLTLVNDAAVEITGHSMEALMGLPQIGRRLWSPEDRTVIDAVVRDALTAGVAEAHGRRLLRADGSTILVDVSVCRLGQPDSKPLCLGEATPIDR
jgi:PAS domain S-box-containing protein